MLLRVRAFFNPRRSPLTSVVLILLFVLLSTALMPQIARADSGSTETFAMFASSMANHGSRNIPTVAHMGSSPLTTVQHGSGAPRSAGAPVNKSILADPFTCSGRQFTATIDAGDVPSLTLAITCANTNGVGTNDVINLTNSTYTLTAVDNTDALFGANGLPAIVDASADGTLTINGNGSTITRSSAGGTPSFRFFDVNSNGNLTLDNLTLSNGLVDGTENAGGAILSEAATLTITNSTISGNSASGSDELMGGGIYGAGTVTITNSSISNNSVSATGTGISAGGSAGGIGFTGGTLTITNSSINNNSVSGVIAAAGGLQADGTVNVSNSTISGNSVTSTSTAAIAAAEMGGMDAIGSVTISNSTISGNTATNSITAVGGGVRISGTGTVVNTTITGNSISASSNSYAGGLYAASATSLTITNSTLASNSAGGGTGGGIDSALSTVTVNNSIIANNTDGDCMIDSGTVTLQSSLIQDSAHSCGAVNGTNGNIVGQDPLLGTLQNNGGSTDTMALQPTSPAINAGSNALAVDQTNAALTTDERGTGFARIADGTVDMGAYEYQFVCSGGQFTTTILASDVTSLINAINCANGNGVNTNDEIDLTNSTYTLTAINNSDGGAGGNGLPSIVSAASDGTLKIEGNGATITRDSGAPQFRFVYVNTGANLTLDDLTLSGSSTTSLGGGVYNLGTLAVTNSTFSDNASANNGGGIANISGTATITNSTFSTNSSGTAGGALYNQATMTVTNSTLSGNSAPDGGGIANGGTTLLTNDTFSANSATSGGGIFSGAGTLTLNNSIVANSTSGGDCVLGSGTINAQNSLIGDSLSCVNGTNTNNLTGNPKLASAGLKNNGGSTLTIALQSDSPAINAGENALAVDQNSDALTTDQRGAGFPRIFNGTVDMGAYEAHAADCPSFPYTVPASDSGLLEYAIICADDNSTNDEIDLTKSTYTLEVANNTAGGVGGNGLPAIGDAGTAGTLTIEGNGATITRDSASGTPKFRIFYLNPGANLTLDDMTVSGGNSTAAGGGIYSNSAAITITNSTFSDNRSNGGGGLSTISTLSEQPIIVINSTFSGNSAGLGGGGGIFIGSGLQPATITNSTFSGNSAGLGGGIFGDNTANAIINNSILAGNTGGDCENIDATSIHYSLIKDGSCGVVSGTNGNLTGDPLLGTLTGSPAYFPLQITSPAINAGDNDLAVEADGTTKLTVDEAGNPRVVGGTVDMGAYEAQVTCPAFPYNVANGDTTNLILAITCANGNANPGVTDEIDLANNGTYTLTTADNPTDGGNGLPVIADATTEGALKIKGNGATITRSGTTQAQFRIFEVGDKGDLTLDDVTISNGNLSRSGGGGIFNNAGTLTISNSTISSNNASGGGGIENDYGDLTITDTTVSNNTSSGNTGGGLEILDITGPLYTATISGSTFTNNSSDSYGGGILSDGDLLTITDSTISGNSANGTGGGGLELGGGVSDNGTTTVIGSTISGNSATGGGGGIFNFVNTVELINSTINGNSATGDGGGIFNNGKMTITNSTISGNTASATDGGNIYNLANPLAINNSIVANSTTGGDCVQGGGTVTANHSLIEDGSCGVGTGPSYSNGDLSGDPKLGTLTGSPAYFPLKSGSPTIDTGKNSLAVDQNGDKLTTDEAGNTRVVNGTVDMGAYESQVACPSFPATIADGDVTELIFAIDCANGNANPGVTDEIDLANNGTYTLTTADNPTDGGNGLPVIADATTEGALRIEGDGATIERGTTLAQFRIFEVGNKGDLTLDDVTVSGGESGSSYGGGIQNQGTLVMIDSTLSDNAASSGGAGGLENAEGTATIINSTLSGNSANGGGGIENDNATLTITNSTLSGNSAVVTGEGGGIFNLGTLNMNNSIVAHSTNGDCLNSGGTATVQYSLIQDSSSSCGATNGTGGNIVGLDPKLDTLTGSPAYFPLKAGSPAIDAGSNPLAVDASSNPLTTDQRGTGFPRILNNTVDMGAFEAPAPPPTVSITGGGAIDEGSTTTITVARTGDTTNPLIVNVTQTPGTDLNPTDYTLTDPSNNPVTTTVTIPAGQASITLTFTALDDGSSAEADETLTIALATSSGYTVDSTNNSATATINANGLTVTNRNDSGEGSLRQAILNANAFASDDTITFATSANGTITLASALPALEDNGTLTIQGNGVANTIINGADTYRVFYVDLSAVVSMSGLTIEHGDSTEDGGGIYDNDGTLTIDSSVLSHNQATSLGGGIRSKAGTVTVINSTISDNTALDGAGLLIEGTAHIINSTISGNTASNHGGGIVELDETITITNSTISGNTANGVQGGGGLYADDGNLNLNNSIVANNGSGDCDVNIGTIGTAIIQYSLIEDSIDSCGAVNGTNNNIVGSDPKLGTLAGSPAYFPLQAGSPAINVGDNDLAVEADGTTKLTLDEAGNTRIIGGTVDMGAFEDQTVPATVSITGGGAIDEGSTTAITVARTGDTTNPLTVNVTLTPGTDLNPTDYTLTDPSSNPVTTTVTIPAGDPSITLTFTALNDGSSAEGDETLTVALVTSGGYTVDSTNNSATATINANGLTVTNTNDSGEGSLRQAILNANAFASDDTITFDPSANGTITLASALPVLFTNGKLTITGNGVANTIISGANTYQVFHVNSGATVNMSGLTVENGSAINGGGIFNNGTLTIDSSAISDNQSSNSGGGINNGAGSLKITSSTISGNSAISGGGIYNQSALTIEDSTISDNSISGSAVAGGGLYSIFTTVIEGSTISGNTAFSTIDTDGAGLYLGGNSFNVTTIINSTVTNNSATGNPETRGGAIDNVGSTLTITNSTFSGNSGVQGGGIYNELGTLNLNNSILAQSDCDLNGGTATIQYSLIENGINSCGAVNGTNGNIFNLDPKLGTLTGSPAYFPLDSDSPAINVGSNALAVESDGTTALTMDEAGNPRVVGGTVDMGAFESGVVPGAILSATKTVSGKFEVGQTVTYTVTITNAGTGAQANNSGHEFSDTLPSDLTLVGADATSGTAGTTGNTVNWDGSLAASGGSTTITITATINAGTVGHTISNQGTLNYDSDGNGTNDATALTDDPNVGGTSDPTVFTVVAPDISVTKSVITSAPYQPGDTLEYEIIINNTGGANADGVTLTDTPDANTTLVAGSVIISQGSVTTGNTSGDTSVVVNIGTLTKTIGTVTITFEAKINNPLPSGTTDVNNTATVTGDNFSSTPSNTEDTPLTTTSTLSLSKTPDVTSVAPDGTIKYTLAYQNTGNVGLDNVTLSDIVPTNTTFDAADSTTGWACTPDNTAGSTCTQTIGTLAGQASGSATYAVTVNGTVPVGTTEIDNSAGIASGQVTKTASATTPLTTSPGLSVQKSDGGITANPGDTIPYTITYTNTGDIGLSNVILTETVPANTSFNAGASTTGWTCTPDNTAGSTCTYTVGELAATRSENVTFAVTVDNPVASGVTEIDNTVSIASGSITANGGDTTPLTTTSTLSLTKTPDVSSVTTGGTIKYALAYQNTGNINLDNVTLSDTVPTNTTFDAADSTTGWICTPDDTAGSACTLTIGTVAGGASGSATYAVTVNATVPSGTTEIDNSATVASGATNKTASATTPLTGVAPSIQVTKTASDVNGGSLVPGDTLKYTITISNSGNTDATNVVLTDGIPTNTIYVAGSTTLNSNPVTDNSGAMPFVGGGSIPDLAAGDTATVVFEVTVNNPLPGGTTEIDNTAAVTADGGISSTSPTATSPVVTGLTITKAFGSSAINPGETTNLTFTLINPTGNPALTGLAFSDTLPNGLVFSGTPTAAQCSGTVSLSSAFTLHFSGGALDAGSSTCTISAVVKADGTVSGTVTNHSSTVTADGGVSSASGASASLSINAGATAIPAAFFECENLDSESGGSMTSDGGIGAVHSGDETGNVYCHIIAKDSSYMTDSAEIGVQSVLDLGVVQAVDVYGELPGGDSVVPFDRPVQICLRGTGEVLFLDAADAGRTVERLTATQQGDYLCVEVTGAGTVVLVSGTSGIAPMAAPATPVPSMPATTTLNACRVTTTNAPLNLRAEPNSSAAILNQLPYNITLTATEMVPGWYHVIYLDGQGWVSATYLSFAGECGQ